MQPKIPVTILTGYLGAGKTTLLNKILQSDSGQKAAVIINEYGEVNIDHELVIPTPEQILQLNNGCLCCTVREDLIEVLQAILLTIERTNAQIDHILVETSGLAEPAPIAQTFLREPFLNEYFSLDSILTLVDMSNISYQLQHSHEAKEQIAFADKLLLTKADLVDPILLPTIEAEIMAINPFAKKEFVSQGEIAISELLDIHTFSAQAKLENHPHFLETHTHHHEEDITSFAIEEFAPLSIDKTTKWLQKLVITYGMQLLRYKGVLYFKNSPKKVIFQGVHMAFQSSPGDLWEETSPKKSTFIFIGNNLDEKYIRTEFQKCILKEDE